MGMTSFSPAEWDDEPLTEHRSMGSAADMPVVLARPEGKDIGPMVRAT